MRITIKSTHALFLITAACFSLLTYEEIYSSTLDSDTDSGRPTLVEQFKEYLEKDTSLSYATRATVEQFVSTVVETVAKIKQQRIEDRIIGIALNEIAEKFKDHDYFSVDRFGGILTVSEQEIENERLMQNWQKWYTYKLLAYFYKRESITKEDENIIDASIRSDNIDRYELSKQYHDQIYALGKPFYTDKYSSGQVIYATLERKLDGFSVFIDSLMENEDEDDVI